MKSLRVPGASELPNEATRGEQRIDEKDRKGSTKIDKDEERAGEGREETGRRRRWKENREGASYLGLSRSLSDRLLVRLTRQRRDETGNYVWGSISGVARGVGARLGGILREKTPGRAGGNQQHRVRGVIKLLTEPSSPNPSSHPTILITKRGNSRLDVLGF